MSIRLLKRIIIHCSHTEAGEDFTAADIDRWHKMKNLRCIGYHYVIRLDGTVERGRLDEERGQHCRGFDEDSLAICYVGGLKRGCYENTMTYEQDVALRNLIVRLVHEYPTIEIIAGHNDYNKTECPAFKVSEVLEEFLWDLQVYFFHDYRYDPKYPYY